MRLGVFVVSMKCMTPVQLLSWGLCASLVANELIIWYRLMNLECTVFAFKFQSIPVKTSDFSAWPFDCVSFWKKILPKGKK